MKDPGNENSSLKGRVPSFLLAGVSFGVICLYYRKWSLIGFPDGHRTELDIVYEKVYPVYMVVSLLFILASLYLGGSIRGKPRRKKLKWVFVFFIIFLLSTFVIAHYLYKNFEHGQGG
ncbi:hypothetical protein QQ020_12700 [Fulvivirgaceae bacterium BMA12]|uniref:Uncharacterized protein n=1 Tax=Agaribacillus aureus TaxID=3051825 RepID=A0ABT8L596_9BACT|nr:hypothetical protein [Fulvivirgaceae bacterium BMA12]